MARQVIASFYADTIELTLMKQLDMQLPFNNYYLLKEIRYNAKQSETS